MKGWILCTALKIFQVFGLKYWQHGSSLAFCLYQQGSVDAFHSPLNPVDNLIILAHSGLNFLFKKTKLKVTQIYKHNLHLQQVGTGPNSKDCLQDHIKWPVQAGGVVIRTDCIFCIFWNPPYKTCLERTQNGMWFTNGCCSFMLYQPTAIF